MNITINPGAATDDATQIDNIIATIEASVETLDAAQILHLKDHGTLPERNYGQNTEEATGDATESTSDAVGAPNDPTIGDLPSEDGSNDPDSPIQEERR